MLRRRITRKPNVECAISLTHTAHMRVRGKKIHSKSGHDLDISPNRQRKIVDKGVLHGCNIGPITLRNTIVSVRRERSNHTAGIAAAVTSEAGRRYVLNFFSVM